MRRDEIQQGVRQIAHALVASGVRAVFVRGGETKEEEEETAVQAIATLRDYAVLESQFTPAAERISKILGLQALTRTELWGFFITAVGRERNPAFSHLQTIVHQALELLPNSSNFCNRLTKRNT